jgi:hypothetical protein
MKNISLRNAVRAIGLGTVIVAGSSGVAHAALLCSAGNILGAGTCTETVIFGPSATDFNATLFLDQFQQSFLDSNFPGFTHTLTAVNWSVQAAMNANGTVTNTSASTQSFTLRETEAVTFAAGAGAPASFLPGGLLSTSDSGLIPFTLAAGAAAPYNLNANTSTVNGSAASLVGYVGNGTFNALVSTMTNIAIAGGGGNISLVAHTTVAPQISLTYTFQTAAPVPEPETYAMMLAGLGLMGFVARRRKQKAD